MTSPREKLQELKERIENEFEVSNARREITSQRVLDAYDNGLDMLDAERFNNPPNFRALDENARREGMRDLSFNEKYLPILKDINDKINNVSTDSTCSDTESEISHEQIEFCKVAVHKMDGSKASFSATVYKSDHKKVTITKK